MFIKWFNEIGLKDINLVGGKNASLGEMVSNMSKLDIRVPYGFAVTTVAYDRFIEDNGLNEFIHNELAKLQLDYSLVNLKRTGMKIRNKILEGSFNTEIETSITEAYRTLSRMFLDMEGIPQENTDVAVRSSGTMEDLPDASFAGQQETYLNVRNTNEVILSIKRCFASLYTDRVIL